MVAESTAELGKLIRRERIHAGLTQDSLAEAIGCSKTHLSLMESGRRTVSLERAREIESALGLTDGRIIAALQWEITPAAVRATIAESQDLTARLRRILLNRNPLDELRRLVEQQAPNVESPQLLRKFRGIPVINKVAAGYPAEFTDLGYPATIADDYITCPDVTDPDAFAARVVGDSMEPTYHEGDIVIFSPLLPTPNGSDCFVRLARDNETTFKRIYSENAGEAIRLQPLNNAYPPRVVDREDIGGMYAAAYVMRRVNT